jgi:ubiquinone/menaquinone biosynthesis C-methylase UbiE
MSRPEARDQPPPMAAGQGPSTPADGTVAARVSLPADPAVRDRHRWLAGLVDATPGARVVDLGCGEGATLAAVTPSLGAGAAVGLDLDDEALREAALTLDPWGSRLALVQADLTRPLPLADASVDVVFSHDVLEALPDPVAVLREAHRVLRQGGRLVVGQPDYDTTVFAGADLDLTRRVVHAYCDTRQPWMGAVDGTLGRRLAEIVSRAPFTDVDVVARVVLSRRFEPGRLGRLAADHAVQVLSGSPALTPAELGRWHEQLAAAAARNAFLFSLNDYVALATKP